MIMAEKDNIKTQMRKGLLEYCILEIIAQQEAYASDILERLKAADLLVVEGTTLSLAFSAQEGRLFVLSVARIAFGSPSEILLFNPNRRTRIG